MDLTLTRKYYLEAGVFGVLSDTTGDLYVTLEHGYAQDDGTIKPKLPSGTYTCQLGSHQLHSMHHTFQTYEVMNVPGHSGILFHMGNYNADSDGCILVGKEMTPAGEPTLITNSIFTLAQLLALQGGVDTFQLTVV